MWVSPRCSFRHEGQEAKGARFLRRTGEFRVGAGQERDLAWSGASGDVVDVYRSGTLMLTTANDGAEGIATGVGTWSFQVCPAGTTTGCSATLSVTQSP